MTPLIQHIEHQRKALGWSQRRLCREAGMTRRSYQRHLAGESETTTVEFIGAMAKALDLEPVDLFMLALDIAPVVA